MLKSHTTLYFVELQYTAATAGDIEPSNGVHWERRLSAAQRRYLNACESRARVRKLARTTPTLQVNIAAPGGQQLNLLGGQPDSDDEG